MFRTHIMSCVSNNKYGYIDMKAKYRREPKDRNIEIFIFIYLFIDTLKEWIASKKTR